jgi:hypothetical protein
MLKQEFMASADRKKGIMHRLADRTQWLLHRKKAVPVTGSYRRRTCGSTVTGRARSRAPDGVSRDSSSSTTGRRRSGPYARLRLQPGYEGTRRNIGAIEDKMCMAALQVFFSNCQGVGKARLRRRQRWCVRRRPRCRCCRTRRSGSRCRRRRARHTRGHRWPYSTRQSCRSW